MRVPLMLSACLLALGWLMPIHFRPWMAFHADAWVAAVLLVATFILVFFVRGSVAIHRITILAGFLVCVPWLQYAAGLIQQSGLAWISCAYQLGLLLALLVGARWESKAAGQLGDALFLAIGMAAICSVGLQLQQWLQLGGLDLLSMGGGSARPYANMGQPNQLATFLLWGVLAAAWGYCRRVLGAFIAVALSAYLLFGVALTGSRSAWLGVLLLVVAAWCWRHLWSGRRVLWVITGLGLYFVLCVLFVGWIKQLMAGSALLDAAELIRMNAELRPLAWKMLIDAALLHPLWGHGWNQTILAQMAVAAEHPHIPAFFTYSHNLFLDWVLWCGIPMGLCISAALVWWFWKRLRAVRSAENWVLVSFLVIAMNHAMLELPLSYAYILLPLGLVMGMLDARLGSKPVLYMGRAFLCVLWLSAALLLAILVSDYSRVEASYQILRLQWARIKITLPVEPPDVLLLTQWHDYIEFARMEPRRGVGAQELEWMRDLTGLFPGDMSMHKLATFLALNQQPDEARVWLVRMCKTIPAVECRNVGSIWAKQSLLYPEIAAIPWPVIQ